MRPFSSTAPAWSPSATSTSSSYSWKPPSLFAQTTMPWKSSCTYTGIATRLSISRSAAVPSSSPTSWPSSRIVLSWSITRPAKRCASALSRGSFSKPSAQTTSRSPSPSASPRLSRMPFSASSSVTAMCSTSARMSCVSPSSPRCLCISTTWLRSSRFHARSVSRADWSLASRSRLRSSSSCVSMSCCEPSSTRSSRLLRNVTSAAASAMTPSTAGALPSRIASAIATAAVAASARAAPAKASLRAPSRPPSMVAGYPSRLLRNQYLLDRGGPAIVARLDQDRVQPRVVGGGLELHGHHRGEAAHGQLLLHADHPAARPGHAHVGHVGGAAGEHARVGRGHVRVCADACRHATVEVPPHRDLLARRLRVEVDEHVVGLALQIGENRVHLGEGRAGGVEEDGAGEVRHRQPHADLLHDGVTAAWVALRVVRGAHDPVVLVEERVDLGVAIGVVAERDGVDACAVQRKRDLPRDAETARGVLAVHDHEVRRVLLHEAGQQQLDGAPSGTPHDVAHEQQLHWVAGYRQRNAAGRTSRFAGSGRGCGARGARPRQALRGARGASGGVAVGGGGRACGRDRPERRRLDDPAVDPRGDPEAGRGLGVEGAFGDRLGPAAGGALREADGGREPAPVRAAREAAG